MHNVFSNNGNKNRNVDTFVLQVLKLESDWKIGAHLKKKISHRLKEIWETKIVKGCNTQTHQGI